MTASDPAIGGDRTPRRYLLLFVAGAVLGTLIRGVERAAPEPVESAIKRLLP